MSMLQLKDTNSYKNIPVSFSALHDQEYIHLLYFEIPPKKRQRRSQSEKNCESYTMDILKQQSITTSSKSQRIKDLKEH